MRHERERESFFKMFEGTSNSQKALGLIVLACFAIMIIKCFFEEEKE